MNNIWNPCYKLITILSLCKGFAHNTQWSWTRNLKCKYIDIRICMYNGSFCLKDRDGNFITIEDVLHQQTGEKNDNSET